MAITKKLAAGFSAINREFGSNNNMGFLAN